LIWIVSKIELNEAKFSIGISIYPDDSEDFEGLINHSDAAMYDSKRNKESCFQHYKPAVSEASG
jgi:GGDEF domain-containing protein